MSIRDDVPLPADVTATIQATSVLGERSIALFPSWSPELEASGVPKLAHGDNLPRDRTEEPVDPDQALPAFTELLAGLDPDAVGRLVTDGLTTLGRTSSRENSKSN